MRDRLTSREREIVQLLAEGKSSKEVASSLNISVKTAETHRANIMRKLQLHTVSELVRYACLLYTSICRWRLQNTNASGVLTPLQSPPAGERRGTGRRLSFKNTTRGAFITIFVWK